MKQFRFWMLAGLLILAGCAGPAGLSGRWSLLSYGDTSLPTPTVGTAQIEFNKDGTVSGNVGCNSFGGQYRVRGTQLTLSNLMSTLMACADENVMQQETRVMEALNNAESFTLEGNQLVIHYGNGKQALTFQRAP